jgi:uncharacterized membrane protein
MHSPEMSAFIQLVLRWFHVFAGVIWIGHLYFFNFVNVPFQGVLDKELKPKVNPALLLRALWWFRWGAMWTFLIGWFLFAIIYLMGGFLWDADGGFSRRGLWMLVGGLLGSVMWFNVWFVIWPAQKQILGGLLGSNPPAPADVPKKALLFARRPLDHDAELSPRRLHAARPGRHSRHVEAGAQEGNRPLGRGRFFGYFLEPATGTNVTPAGSR